MGQAERVEHVVVGAGPAGLRAAQVLADAGREVLVLEKSPRVGPKTCGGGLTPKAVQELSALGLEPTTGIESLAHISFRGEPAAPMDPDLARIRTVARERLGSLQAEWATRAGATIRTAAPVSRIDPANGTLHVNGSLVRYRHLIGADGSGSAVRRALGLPAPRAFFAGEYNIRGISWPHLVVEFDSEALASGYFWLFPHEDYLSVGAGVHKGAVAPASVRSYLQRRMRELGLEAGETPYEGATVETHPVGFHHGERIHLVGDAAGMASGLSAEGIYAALITGEEVARSILEPGWPMAKTRAWLRCKRLQDGIGRLWLRRCPRDLSLVALRRLTRGGLSRRWTSRFFLEG